MANYFTTMNICQTATDKSWEAKDPCIGQSNLDLQVPHIICTVEAKHLKIADTIVHTSRGLDKALQA